MDFGLTEEQRILQTVAREWLANRCPKSLVREMEKDPKGYVPELWREMADNGWLGLAIPEEYGGAGMTFLDLAVLLEEMGRACLPGPYFSTVILAGAAILEAGSDAQKAELLPRIASGDLIATLALAGPGGGWNVQSVALTATPTDSGFAISGTTLFVPDANVADVIVAAAKTGNGITLFLVNSNSPGLTVSPLQTIAGDKQCEVVFDNVAVPGERLLGELGQGGEILKKVLEKATIAKCAESVGGAQQALEMSVNYAKERVQFGKPIGTMQVLQHYCANMATDVDGSRFVTYQAAWRLSTGLAASTEVAIAKAWTSEAYRRIAAQAHQLHAAIGFTEEYDLQLYSRRAKTAEVLLGDADYHREAVAKELGL